MSTRSWSSTGRGGTPPPYSPALDPVERVWLHLRERFLSLRRLDDYDAILTACRNAWMTFAQDSETLEPLRNYPWIGKAAS